MKLLSICLTTTVNQTDASFKNFNNSKKLYIWYFNPCYHAHTTEKSFTHLLTAKVELVTKTDMLRKQTALYKRNAWVKIHYIKQILVQKTFKRKFITRCQKQKFKARYSNHKKSFNHKKQKNDMQLLNELWKTKALKEEQVLVWKILGRYQPKNVNIKLSTLLKWKAANRHL